MVRLCAIAAAVILLCASSVADDAQPPPSDPDLGTFIVTAAAFDGNLWVLGAPPSKDEAGGALVSFGLADGARQLRISNALALQKTGGRLVVLVATGPKHYALREWVHGAFVDLPLPTTDEPPDQLLSMGDAVGMMAGGALFKLEGRNWQTVWRDTAPADNRPPPGAVPMSAFGPYAQVVGVPASGSSIYSGFNRGEWGGGFDRLDLATGKARGIENSGKAPDGEAIYNSGLDPVNAIISDPANRDCVIVAVGLMHFMASGRLLRACGDDASIAFDPVTQEEGRTGNTIYHSEAFFGLVPAKEGYWAVSNAAVYRFGMSGAPNRFLLTHFAPWHGLWISREAPGALVLVTEINRRFSVNNGTPLIVPLD
jgi:hypothetical protein